MNLTVHIMNAFTLCVFDTLAFNILIVVIKKNIEIENLLIY